MMTTIRPPGIRWRDRLVASEELAATAAAWLDFIRERTPASAGGVALALSNDPHAIALFFSLSTLPLPVIVFGPDPRSWKSRPAVAAATPLFLPPGLAHLAPEGRRLGLATHAVPDPRSSSLPSTPLEFLACPGQVLFTSGSTGPAKPVCIRTRAFLRQTASIVDAYRLPDGCGLVGALPLSTHYGFGHALMLPAVLGARLSLVERFDHRAVLRQFRSEENLYLAATPVMADMLARAPLRDAVPASPAVCHISAGSLSAAVARAYVARFGVPLRPSYGRTENGFITAETAPASEVRWDAVGTAAPGIELRIGDDPEKPYAEGKPGRVWFSSPWYMEGYGFPPALAPRNGRDGWWPTEDLGVVDGAGYLTLLGRIDDCFKTTTGYLVNPAEIAAVLAEVPGAGETCVVPVPSGAGTVIGALVEAAGSVDVATLRTATAGRLSAWFQPEIILVTDALPRLPGGKVDRRACITILEEARRG